MKNPAVLLREVRSGGKLGGCEVVSQSGAT